MTTDGVLKMDAEDQVVSNKNLNLEDRIIGRVVLGISSLIISAALGLLALMSGCYLPDRRNNDRCPLESREFDTNIYRWYFGTR